MKKYIVTNATIHYICGKIEHIPVIASVTNKQLKVLSRLIKIKQKAKEVYLTYYEEK